MHSISRTVSDVSIVMLQIAANEIRSKLEITVEFPQLKNQYFVTGDSRFLFMFSDRLNSISTIQEQTMKTKIPFLF